MAVSALISALRRMVGDRPESDNQVSPLQMTLVH